MWLVLLFCLFMLLLQRFKDGQLELLLWLVLLLSLFSLTACAHYIQDEPHDPRQTIVPTAEQQAADTPASAPPLSPGVSAPAAPLAPRRGWSAWVVRKVTPQGDVIAGHEIEISLDAPHHETVPSLHPIPVTPPFSIPKASAGTAAPPSKPPPSGSMPPPVPGLPPGWPPVGPQGQALPFPLPTMEGK